MKRSGAIDAPDTSGDPRRELLAGGGEMGALIRGFDWKTSPVGPPETWPQGLRTTVRILLSTQHPMFIWWGPELIQFYNDAYRKTMGPERHPSALGQPGRECWAEIWDIIGPQIEYVMAGKGSTWHEDQLVPVTRFGSRRDVWWTYGYSPIDDGQGGVGGVLVICNDVTEQHLSQERLRDLFQQAPGFVAILRGPDHVFELTNDAYAKLVANRDVIGRPLRDALPEVVDQGFIDLLDGVFSTGEPFTARSWPVMLRSDDERMLERHFLDFLYQPIFGVDDQVTGIFVQGHDVSEQKAAEEHRMLLAGELNHRVKNTLAMAQAIAGQTLRGSPEIDQARSAFTSRLMALARTQDILIQEEYQGADLQAVIASALEHHAGGQNRFRIEGPRLRISAQAATSLAMVFHELSTNAAKYGGLSTPEGRVEVTWETNEAEVGGRRLFLRWSETGGPAVEVPKHTGFGTRLIDASVSRELGGEVRVEFEPAGIIYTIRAPLERVQEDSE